MGLFGKKAYNGITSKTPQHLQLDAGAFFKNFEVGKDTYASAKKAGKCLGATQGGGTFTAKPSLRNIDVDGTVGRVKGLTDIETWEVSISATLLEVTTQSVSLALAGAVSETGTPEGYTVIKGNAGIADADYIQNITWIGSLTGSADPIIIQLENGLNEDGLSFDMAPKSEGKIKITFYAYNDLADFESDTVNPPFAIYLPDVEADTASTVSTAEVM